MRKVEPSGLQNFVAPATKFEGAIKMEKMMNEAPIKKIDWLVLPIIGALLCVGVWHLIAGKKVYALKSSGGIAELHANVVPNLPNGEADWKIGRAHV